MKKLEVEKDLKHLFEKFPSLKNEDAMKVYYKYISLKYVNSNSRITFEDFFNYTFYDKDFRKEFKIASFQSIERTKRDMQNTQGLYIPDKKVKELRQENEFAYYKSSKGYNVELY